MYKRWWFLAIAAIALCVVVALVALGHTLPLLHFSVKTEIFSCWIKKLGIWGPVVYLLGYVVRPLVLIPSVPFAILGGVLFGSFWGALYIMVGTICSSVVEFTIVRYFIGEKAKQFLKKRAQGISQVVKNNGFVTVFFVRLIPNVAFDLQNCGLALAPIKFSDYFYGTIFGCLPACIFYASFGRLVTKGSIFLGVSLVLLLIATLYIAKRWLRHKFY